MDFSKFLPERFRRQPQHEPYDEAAAIEHMRNRRPQGPGLPEWEVNWDLYRAPFESRQFLTSGSPDFWQTQMQMLQQYMELPRSVDVPLASQLRTGPSGEVMWFMEKHRNRNAFFTPEMITEALADVPEIIIDHGEADGVEVWNFTTVTPEDEIEKLTLVRAGEHPTIRTAPYLGITYVAEYDFANEQLQFVPQFMMEWRDDINNSLPRRGPSQLQSYITAALGLEPQVIDQRLSFTVENEPFRYISLEGGAEADASNPAESTLGRFAMGQIQTPPYVRINLA